jgi:hypothetical protein
MVVPSGISLRFPPSAFALWYLRLFSSITSPLPGIDRPS